MLHYTNPNGTYFNLECHGVRPKTVAVALLELHLYSPAIVPELVLDPSVCQEKPASLCGLDPFFRSHLLGHLAVNVL